MILFVGNSGNIIVQTLSYEEIISYNYNIKITFLLVKYYIYIAKTMII